MVRFRWDIYLLPPAPPSLALWIFRGIIAVRKAAGSRLRLIYLFPPATLFNVAFPSGKAERPIVKEIHHPLNLELRWDFPPRPIRLRRKAKIL